VLLPSGIATDAIAQYPRIASLVLALPGNHDLNVVDRSNPAKKRLRHIRTMSALSAIQGASVHIDAVAGLVGIEGGVVSGVFNLESSGVRASDWRPRHDKRYHEA
jgi:hypothetical protein